MESCVHACKMKYSQSIDPSGSNRSGLPSNSRSTVEPEPYINPPPPQTQTQTQTGGSSKKISTKKKTKAVTNPSAKTVKKHSLTKNPSTKNTKKKTSATKKMAKK